ncbi:HPF/RaiA family ribosome-associated protein [Methylocapsa aurea]|uniref:HPF/RaiA family ribosome-associated protein n=1 Tax=Methylocapsa aurea TaxID=663610 RepID=UPI00068C7E15|nr:HPF/RaiA family ribosome-associated protein [Methylocapsa aurea]
MDRPLQIVFRDIERSASLARLIREKAQRLEHFYSHIIGCRVVAEGFPHGSRAVKKPLAIAVEIEVPGRPKLVARSQAAPHAGMGGENVINRVFDAARRQLEDLAAIVHRRS